MFLRIGYGNDHQACAMRNTDKTSDYLDNRTRGIMLRTFSTENEIKENTFAGNRVGILLFGAVDTTEKDNLVANSLVAGIRINVVATGNDVKANTVSANPAGIEFLRSGPQTPTGNTLVENTIVLNTCGIKGATEGNTIKEQDFGGNGTDVCP